MCYGVARPEPTGREFAGFESVDGGVRGILGGRHKLLLPPRCPRYAQQTLPPYTVALLFCA